MNLYFKTINLLRKRLFNVGKAEDEQLDLMIKQDDGFYPMYEQCKPYTMTSIERMYALYKAVEYIVKSKLEGDFVECGVWKGGSSMMMALTLAKFGITDRKIYLYDTFTGMSEPSEFDSKAGESLLTKEKWVRSQNGNHNKWCFSPLDEVEANMQATGYPIEKIVFVKGKVEETIPGLMPEAIALLRLDTDWYESTNHELNHLFPLLKLNGVLIIDDYGTWAGARKAVDEYFGDNDISILLNRIDSTGRLAIKIK